MPRMKRMKIEKRLAQFAANDPDGCWIWPGALNRAGYGSVTTRFDNERGYLTRIAHRVAYEIIVGPVPAGAELDHLCRQRACVNPKHLEPVSHRENVRRGTNPSSAKTHCKWGHAFTEDNIRYARNGRKRVCRKCATRRSSEDASAKKQQRLIARLAGMAQFEHREPTSPASPLP